METKSLATGTCPHCGCVRCKPCNYEADPIGLWMRISLICRDCHGEFTEYYECEYFETEFEAESE